MSYMRVYYYENELEDEFSSASIKAKKIDADYDYSMDSAGRRFLHFFYIWDNQSSLGFANLF